LQQAQAASILGWSRAKLVKIERAQAVPTVADVEAILNAYSGEDGLKLALLQLAKDVRKRGWWTAYGDVLSESFAQLEDAASAIRSWQLEIVPGLLQTEDYARALIRAVTGNEEEVDRRLEARLMRQTVLSRQGAPTMHVLLHESVLRTPIGGRDVIRSQLAALRTAGRRHNVSVRVLPNSVGVRPGMGEGSFTIFDFPEPMDVGVTHLESVAGDVYVEDAKHVERCNVMYERITDASLSEEDSAELISAFIEE
jgi:hypothetical protein